MLPGKWMEAGWRATALTATTFLQHENWLEAGWRATALTATTFLHHEN
jgi:hypothetical protein